MRSSATRLLRIAALGLVLVACDAGRMLSPIAGGTAAYHDLATDGIPRIVITEFMADPTGIPANSVLDANGEYFELFNAEAVPVSLAGWTVSSNNANETFTFGALTIPALSCVAVGLNADVTTNGAVPIAYQYPSAFNIANSGTAEIIELKAPNGTQVDIVRYGSPAPTITAGRAYEFTNANNDNTTVSANASWVRNAADRISGLASSDLGRPGVCPGGAFAAVSTLTFPSPTTSVSTSATLKLTPIAKSAANVDITTSTAIRWTSSDPTTATVDKMGLVTGIKAGTVTITAASHVTPSINAGVTVTVAAPAVTSVTLSPTAGTAIVGGKTLKETPTATDANGANITSTTSFTWTSSDNAIATVDAAGNVSGVAPGSATITATSANGTPGSAAITVKSVGAVSVTPVNTTVFTGSTQQYQATAFDTDGANVSSLVTFAWTSSDVAVISISATGLATGVTVGTVTITAAAGGKSAEATLRDVDPPVVTLPAVRFSEIHYDNTGTDANERIEVEAPVGTSLDGYSIALYDGSTSSTTGLTGAMYNLMPLSGLVTGSCNQRGVAFFSFAQIQNGSPDGLALVDPSGHVVEFLSYEGTFVAFDGPAADMVSVSIEVEEGSSTGVNQSLSRQPNGNWSAPSGNTFGQPNACANGSNNSPTLTISTNGPDTLVVGWQRRGFVTYFDANGNSASLPGPIVWSSETPTLAGVDQLGYATGLTAGDAIIRATVGTATNVYHVQVIDYEATKATYHNHLEIGAPLGVDPNNDVRLDKIAFSLSYNSARGGPNWVAWNINATTFGAADRCECFSTDITLPVGQVRITDQDYVNGGYDRGHMVQSESRTSTHSDNAATFLLTQILPQAANNNQGAWLGFEEFTNAFAQSGKDVYVVAGGEYAATPTTLKGAGRVAIPDYTWKVAVVLDPGVHAQNITSLNQLQVFAVRIPNLLATAPATKSRVWQPYQTTAADIQQRTGLDLLAALPDNIERAVEIDDRAPVAAATGPTSGNEGSSLNFDANGSSDPDAFDAGHLTYSWDFGDGTTGTGVALSHTFANNGTYTVKMTVSDGAGITATATLAPVVIANVAPTAEIVAPGSVEQGTSFNLTLQNVFDPSPVDRAALQYAFDCGAGFGALQSAASASCATPVYGVTAVRARVVDPDGGSTTYDATVDITRRPCVAGSYRPEGSHADCIPASPGSFVAGADAIVQELCAAGSYQPNSGQSSCLLAQPGYFVALSGAVAATPCAAGSYQSAVGASSCVLAPIGSYVAAAGAAAVTICPTGMTTLQAGSASASACVWFPTTVLIQHAIDLTNSQVEAGQLAANNAKPIVTSLEAAQASLAKGNSTPARNQLEAAKNKVAAAVNSGKMTAAQAAEITAAIDLALSRI